MHLSRAEFEKLALEQIDLLYRVARKLTHNQQAAEDLVQDTYLRAIRAHKRFDLQEYGIRPWLLRIMHNLHVSNGLRDKRRPTTVDGEFLDASSARLDPLPLDRAALENVDGRIVKALDQLPAEYQVVLLLWAIEDFSYKEIAVAVDVPIGTVMSRLHRARQKLAEVLRTYAVQEGVIRE
jgi:RNA polymerase sigma-70 factor (ECF subfamily)